jgi:hypothetical protein
MSAPPEPPGPGLSWVRHEDYVEQQIAAMVAQLDRHILEEPDPEWRAAMWRLRPKAVAQIKELARTALHVGTEH